MNLVEFQRAVDLPNEVVRGDEADGTRQQEKGSGDKGHVPEEEQTTDKLYDLCIFFCNLFFFLFFFFRLLFSILSQTKGNR